MPSRSSVRSTAADSIPTRTTVPASGFATQTASSATAMSDTPRASSIAPTVGLDAGGDLPERSLRRRRHPGRIGTDRDRTDGGRGHARARDRPRGAFVEPRHDAVDAQHPDAGGARGDRGGAHGPRAGGDGAGCGVDPHDPEIGRDRPDGALVRRHVVLDEIRERAAAPGAGGSRRAWCRSSSRAARRLSPPAP